MSDEVDTLGAAPGPLVRRTPKGQFLQGHRKVGGRKKGAKNRATLVKEAMEEKSTLMLGRMAPHLFKKAMEMAMAGDAIMMKEMIARINPKVSTSEDTDKTVEVTINNFTAPPPQGPGVLIEGTSNVLENDNDLPGQVTVVINEPSAV
jgi:hypothetical protein